MTVEALTRNELVDDRAVGKADDDRFRHSDFVQELGALAATMPTPANVALYAPWGSGKSGLAHLLAQRFKDDKAVEFVHFDAFKHGEAPLRRQFLVDVAGQLAVSSPKEIDQALYDSTTTNELNVTGQKAWGLVRLFLAILGVLGVLIAIGAVVYAFVSRLTGASTSWWDLFVDAVAWAAPKAFVPATLLSALAGLTGNQFKTERRIEPARTDEQFERIFKDVIREARSRHCVAGSSEDDRKRRVVVFIDELDRCSPAEVASTLETLRTFLEVKGCVFIVAADQQALEEALTHRVRQATPTNLSSPYYSVGSAYLDKIFQVQLQLPPIKPQRLTRYALELVAQREGVWRRLQNEGADLGEVISVLIPSHVNSPRRVKALLNNFALNYRLAERRADQDAIARGVAQRALEIAKLTCLRLEFPLFAADLPLDARLPGLVVRAHKLMAPPVDEEREEELKELLRGLRTEVQDRARKWAALELAPDRSLAADERADESVTPVEQELASQLMRYLRKTSSVQDPQADLIHLESAAAAFEYLDQADGDALEQLAVDADIEGVRELLGRLTPDAARDGVRLLAGLIGHATVGLEGGTAVRTLFAALGELDLDLDAETADAAARAVTNHEFELDGPALLGALRLCRQTRHQTSALLRKRVISSPEALTTSSLQAEILGQADAFLPDHSQRLAGVVLEAAYKATPLRALQSLEIEVARAVIRNFGSELKAGRVVPKPIVEGEFQIAGVLEDDFGAPEARALREAFAAALLAPRAPELDASVLAQRELLEKSVDPEFVAACLKRVPDGAGDADAWLGMVDLQQVEQTDEVIAAASEAVTFLAITAWDAEDFESSILALEGFQGAGLVRRDAEVEGRVAEELRGQGLSANKVERARQLVALGLLGRQSVADASLAGVKAAVEMGYAQSRDVELRAILSEERSHASGGAVTELRDALIEREPFPGSWHSVVIELSLAAELPIPYGDDTIASLATNHLDEFRTGLSLWIQHSEPDAERLLAVLSPMLHAAPMETIGVILRDQHAALSARGIAGPLAASVAAGYLEGKVHRNWLRAARVDGSPIEVIQAMEARVAAGNVGLQDTEQLLDLWEELHLKDDQAKRALATKVLVPLARLDGDSYLALTGRLAKLKDLAADRRRAILSLLREAAERRGTAEQLEEQVDDAGLIRRKGPFGMGGKTDV